MDGAFRAELIRNLYLVQEPSLVQEGTLPCFVVFPLCRVRFGSSISPSSTAKSCLNSLLFLLHPRNAAGYRRNSVTR